MGIFAYELATKTVPFENTKDQERLEGKILIKESPRIGGQWSEEYQKFIDECLNKDADKRLTVDELLQMEFMADGKSIDAFQTTFS
jgi:serine/threonine protein kinase